MVDAAVNLGELVASERNRVLRFCCSKIFDKAAAEDVTQQIFVKFAEEMANSAKPIRNPKAWLTRAAKNECADYGRRLVQRRTGRRPKRKSRNDSTPEKPLHRAILLYENELPESSGINSNDEADLDPFNKVIDQAAMDQANQDYAEEYEELSASQMNLIRRLKRPERLAFLACGPWHLSEYDASMFLGAELAKKVVRERRDWPKGIPIVEAARIFSVNNGTLSSQMSRATAKLRSNLCQLASSRPNPAERPDEPRTRLIEPPTEPVVNSPATTLTRTSQAFARIVMKEPTKLVPGWAGTPPSRSADLPHREFSQIDQGEALRKISYRCGSYLKGCLTCGDVRYAGKCKECGTEIHSTQEMPTAACEGTSCRERPMVKLRKYYTSGCSVRKAYSPKAAGWTYWCYKCGARDEKCWEGFVGERGRGSPVSGRNARKCSRILQLLKVAEKPDDMEIAGLRFHNLQGNPKRWSVCATVKDRIIFGWLGESVSDVEFEDFYQGRTEVMEKNGGPVHPGAIIKQDILPFVGLSVTAAAKALGVSPKTLQDILKKRKPLSTIMCLKMSRLFGSSPEVWMRLQAAYDLKKALQDKKVMARISRIKPVKVAGTPEPPILQSAGQRKSGAGITRE